MKTKTGIKAQIENLAINNYYSEINDGYVTVNDIKQIRAVLALVKIGILKMRDLKMNDDGILSAVSFRLTSHGVGKNVETFKTMIRA
jgi:hypothetical protein